MNSWELVFMKVKDLLKHIEDDLTICVDGKMYTDGVPAEILDKKINSIDVHTERTKDDLDSLGYSFEVGV